MRGHFHFARTVWGGAVFKSPRLFFANQKDKERVQSVTFSVWEGKKKKLEKAADFANP